MIGDDARLIAESAADFAAGQGGPGKARRHEEEGGLDRECWRGMADLGWFAIAVPEGAGGLGLGAEAACLVAEAAGRALLTPPLQAGIAAASLLASSADRSARDALEASLAGSSHVTFAAARVDTRVTTGFVADLDLADGIVLASGTGAEFEARLLRLGTEGVEIGHERCVDGSTIGRALIERVAWVGAPKILEAESGETAWRRAVDLRRLLDSATLCGLMDGALEIGLDYLRLRRQFGVAIGSFQALQHRAVDCHVRRSAARALWIEAARAIETPRAAWAAEAAMRVAARSALHVVKENVQFHGAIGFADEHDAGLYLRRVMAMAARQHA